MQPDLASTTAIRKKLIEVSIPLEAINAASAREKSIRHGHPSTLHLWWARRPLAACRAVLFAQLVDDPSAWPGRYPFPEIANDEDAERRRLHRVIEAMVPWEKSNDEAILNAARWEIARSVAWGLGEEPPPRGDGKAILDYLQTKAPPVYDPFSGGGSIPLEAQRLGLRAYGSDLNPVAVLIGKALVEIPPKFAGLPPVNPEALAELKRGGRWQGKGAQGLAEDVRYYGRWMRNEAEKRIGHLYPKATLRDGSEVTVIAWLWARTVRSPDPAAKGAMVPLVSSFMLSTKEGKKSWVEPAIDPEAPDGWRFEVRMGALSKTEEKKLSEGTKAGRAIFRCILTGASIGGAYIDGEAQAGRMSARLMAIVAEGQRSRVYLSPFPAHGAVAELAVEHVAKQGDEMDLPRQECRGTFASNAQGRRYCFKTFADYFTPRQLLALTTFSDLVAEAREQVLAHARTGDLLADARSLHEGGSGAEAYADAVATFLTLGVGKMADYNSTIVIWSPTRDQAKSTFARQALPMTWDFSEINIFAEAAGDYDVSIRGIARVLNEGVEARSGYIEQFNASTNNYPVRPVFVSTDPPYYDNIEYADLSDFFYVWLRQPLRHIWPNLFRRLTTPKSEELVATLYRHGGREAAEAFFMSGMAAALSAMRKVADDQAPLSIYYAFKQSEIAEEGVTSAGWASFLQAVVNAGLVVDGTWPVRTERGARTIGIGTNALASSVVLVCRKREAGSPIVARADLVRLLKRELPNAIDAIRKAGVGPVDMQQSVIGPGMGVFSRYARVLEDDDSAMTVKTALALINRVWSEIEHELDGNFDPETQVALAWYGDYGMGEGSKPQSSGTLIGLATPKNTSDRALFGTGIFQDLKGRATLTSREAMHASALLNDAAKSGNAFQASLRTVWGCVQATATVLTAEEGGIEPAARLVAQMGARSADALKLAGRLFQIATQKGWSAEALVYNELAEVWPKLEDAASALDADKGQTAPAQRGLFEEA